MTELFGKNSSKDSVFWDLSSEGGLPGAAVAALPGPRPGVQPHEGGRDLEASRRVHPVCCLRFASDWTQPLDILNADSEFVCYYLSNKRCLGNTTLGTNLGQRILAMRTGCKQLPQLIHLSEAAQTTCKHDTMANDMFKQWLRALCTYTL